MLDKTRTPDVDENEAKEGEARRDEPALNKVTLKDLDVTDSYGGAIKGGVPNLPESGG